MRRSASVAGFLVLLAASQPIGTVWHEVVGHGLTGVLAGGRITRVEVWGLQVWPTVRWGGFQGHYGECGVEGIPTATGEHLMELAGSMSTWLVALIATVILWMRWPRGWRRAVLIVLSLWWIDLFTYLLPSWGIRRSVLWGQSFYSEPVEAAVGLGIPRAAFQLLAVTSCVLMAAMLAASLWRDGVTVGWHRLRSGEAPRLNAT